MKILKIPKLKAPRVEAPEPPAVEHEWANDQEIEEVVEAVAEQQPIEPVEPNQQEIIIGKELINGEMIYKVKTNYYKGKVGDVLE